MDFARKMRLAAAFVLAVAASLFWPFLVPVLQEAVETLSEMTTRVVERLGGEDWQDLALLSLFSVLTTCVGLVVSPSVPRPHAMLGTFVAAAVWSALMAIFTSPADESSPIFGGLLIATLVSIPNSVIVYLCHPFLASRRTQRMQFGVFQIMG